MLMTLFLLLALCSGTKADLMSKIKLPAESEVTNFSLDWVKKTKAGFEVQVDWGRSMYHYEVIFYFRCKRNNFYLYRVEHTSLLTKHPERGYWDTQKLKVTKVRNLPVEKFDMRRYL